MSRVVSVPIAPLHFKRDEEQVFRDLVRREIQNSVARSSMFNPTTNHPIFWGQPHAQALGTNNAFSVPAATLTYLPFPNITMTHENLVASGEFKTAFAMDIEATINLYHPSPGGAARTAQYTLYFSGWDGSSYGPDTIVGAATQDFSAAWSLNVTVMIASAGLKFLRARLIHNDVTANVFDLTQSWFSVKQLGANPVVSSFEDRSA